MGEVEAGDDARSGRSLREGGGSGSGLLQSDQNPSRMVGTVKRVIQSYKSGQLNIVEVPLPANRAGHLLVRTVASLVSVGTEKYMLELAQKSLLGKALARPDLVRQVITKASATTSMED